jgi:hypothetical protein
MYYHNACFICKDNMQQMQTTILYDMILNDQYRDKFMTGTPSTCHQYSPTQSCITIHTDTIVLK